MIDDNLMIALERDSTPLPILCGTRCIKALPTPAGLTKPIPLRDLPDLTPQEFEREQAKRNKDEMESLLAKIVEEDAIINTGFPFPASDKSPWNDVKHFEKHVVESALIPVLWRHIKTRGFYRVLHLAREESTSNQVVVYQNTDSGEVWVRPLDEFIDGRFKPFKEEAL